MINNGLLVEEHTGRLILIQVGPTFPDSARLFGPQLRQWEPIIERIADFFLRMRGQDAEIAATVHFASQRLLERMTDATENDVLHAVMMWKQRRKPPLGDGDVAQSIRNLNLMGWISVMPSKDLPLAQPDPLLV